MDFFLFALPLILLTGTIINYIDDKKWYNLMQLIGAIGLILPVAVRMFITKSLAGNNNIVFLLLCIGVIGIVSFIIGYLSMAIQKKKTIKPLC